MKPASDPQDDRSARSTGTTTTQYIDCTNPQGIKTYDYDNACRTVTPPLRKPEPFLLMQRIRVKTTTGFRCTVRVSKFRYSCGVWSHLKTADIPSILTNLEVSTSWCKALSRTRTFVPPGTSQSFNIRLDTTNIIPVQTRGELKIQDGSVSCTGEDGRIGVNVVKGLMENLEFHVTVTTESFTINGHTVNSDSDHIEMPRTCPSTSGACETGSGTFIWEIPVQACDLELVQHVNPQNMGEGIWLDEQNKLILNVTRKTYLHGCGQRDMYETTYEDVILVRGTTTPPGTRPVSPQDVKLDLQITSMAAYTSWRSETLHYEILRSWRHNSCRQDWRQEPGVPRQLEGNLYGLQRGGVIYTFQCQVKEAEIRESERCYADVPLATTPPTFMDPITRLMKTHSPAIKCNRQFPLKLKAGHQWIEILPHVRRAIPPLEKFPVVTENQENHEDMSHAGVYTNAETEAWEELLSFPSYHQALLNELTLGTCVGNQQCGIEIPSSIAPAYDLANLIKQMEEETLWGRINRWLLQNGALLSFIAILLIAGSWTINFIVLATALLREGPAHCIAVFVQLFCTGHTAYHRTARRRRRYAAKTSTREEEEEVPLRDIPILQFQPLQATQKSDSSLKTGVTGHM